MYLKPASTALPDASPSHLQTLKLSLAMAQNGRRSLYGPAISQNPPASRELSLKHSIWPFLHRDVFVMLPKIQYLVSFCFYIHIYHSWKHIRSGHEYNEHMLRL